MWLYRLHKATIYVFKTLALCINQCTLNVIQIVVTTISIDRNASSMHCITWHGWWN